MRVRSPQPDEELYAHRPTWRRLQNRSRTLSMIHLDHHRDWLADKPHQVVLTDAGVVERRDAYLRSARTAS